MPTRGLGRISNIKVKLSDSYFSTKTYVVAAQMNIKIYDMAHLSAQR